MILGALHVTQGHGAPGFQLRQNWLPGSPSMCRQNSCLPRSVKHAIFPLFPQKQVDGKLGMTVEGERVKPESYHYHLPKNTLISVLARFFVNLTSVTVI